MFRFQEVRISASELCVVKHPFEWSDTLQESSCFIRAAWFLTKNDCFVFEGGGREPREDIWTADTRRQGWALLCYSGKDKNHDSPAENQFYR